MSPEHDLDLNGIPPQNSCSVSSNITLSHAISGDTMETSIINSAHILVPNDVMKYVGPSYPSKTNKNKCNTFHYTLNPKAPMFKPSLCYTRSNLNPLANDFYTNFTNSELLLINNQEIATLSLDTVNELHLGQNISYPSEIITSLGDSSSETITLAPRKPKVSVLLHQSSFFSNPSENGQDEEDTAYLTLNNLRVQNVNKILIGHLNINSIRNKFELFADLVKDKLDIILISETKIDSTFPKSQFEIQGYSPPHRLDRNAHGEGFFFTPEVIFLVNLFLQFRKVWNVSSQRSVFQRKSG